MHHAYPYDFKDIVELFMDENYMILQDFSDPTGQAQMMKEAIERENAERERLLSEVNPNKIVTVDMRESKCQQSKNELMWKQKDYTALNAIEYEFGEFKEEELRKKFAE